MNNNKCENCIYEPMCGLQNLCSEEMIEITECVKFKDKSLFVEVVRCNDCIYYGGITNDFVCKIFSGDETKICMNSDDYCSYAERKLCEVGE